MKYERKPNLKLKFWNPEYQTVWNPESIGMESGIQSLESGIHGVESGIQDSLGFLYMGRTMGLRSAAMACQRPTSAVTWILAQRGLFVFNYLDDFIGISPSADALISSR